MIYISLLWRHIGTLSNPFVQPWNCRIFPPQNGRTNFKWVFGNYLLFEKTFPYCSIISSSSSSLFRSSKSVTRWIRAGGKIKSQNSTWVCRRLRNWRRAWGWRKKANQNDCLNKRLENIIIGRVDCFPLLLDPIQSEACLPNVEMTLYRWDRF